MQIYELTKSTKVDEGILDTAKAAAGKIGAGIKGAKQGYQDAQVDRKTAEVADKAYNAWSTYRRQLDRSSPGGKADPAMVEKQLMAFVSKNLLGGQYLPNLVNKSEILSLVKQIAQGGGTSAPAPAQKQQPPAQQAAQKPAAAKTNTAPKAKTTAGAGAFGQMAGQLGAKTTGQPNTMANTPVSRVNKAKSSNPNQPQQTPVQQATALHQQVQGQSTSTLGKVPSTPAGASEPISIGGQKLNPKDPAQAALIKKAQAAAAKIPVQEAIPTVRPQQFKTGGLAARSAQRNAPAASPAAPSAAPAPAVNAPAAPATSAPATSAPAAPNDNSAQEKELFKKLAQQAALATGAVETGNDQAHQGAPAALNKTAKSSDPRALQGQVQDAEKKGGVDPAILAKAGQILRDTFTQGKASVSKTGDSAVDALLLSMGFKL